MPAVRVVIDSSAWRTVTPGSIVAKRLGELQEAGVLQIFVPSLIEREVASGIAEDVKRLTKDQLRLADWCPGDKREATADVLRAADKALEEAVEAVREGVREFFDALHVTRLTIDAADVERVFDGYFEGAPPFGAKKARKDIPDAFILASLKRLAQEGPLHVVTGDARLGRACKEDGKAIVHEDFGGLFGTPELAPHFAFAKRLANLREREQDLVDRLDVVLGEAVRRRVVHGPFASDHGEATVSDWGSVDECRVDWNRAAAIGERSLLLPVKATMSDTLVDLFVFKHDYWAIDDRSSLRYSLADGDWNEHYVWAQAHVSLAVDALLAIEIVDGEDEPFGLIEVQSIKSVEVTEAACG